MLVANNGLGRNPSSVTDESKCPPVPGTDPSTLSQGCPEEESAFQRSENIFPTLGSEPKILPFLDHWTQRISQAGAVLGLATLACPYIRPLGVLGNMSIALLSSTPVAATLLGSGTYLTVRHAPHAKAALGRFISGDYRKTESNIMEDGLFLGSYGIGLLGIGVGFASFGLGGRAYFRSRMERLAQNFPPKKAGLSGYIHGDTVRRAVMDPEIWIQFSTARTSGWQRKLLENGGWWANRILIQGSAGFGVGHFALGGLKLLGDRDSEWNAEVMFNLGAQLALDVAPGVSIALYRLGRGHRKVNMGPGVSNEYTEAHYSNPNLREIVYHRIRKSVPPIRSEDEYAFMNTSRLALEKISKGLDIAETLPPLKPLSLSSEMSFPSLGRSNDPIILNSAKPTNFSNNARDIISEKTADLLSEASLPQWAQTYASGEVSPVGVLRYIQNDPAVKNSAIFPRDITKSPLARLLLQRALESEQRFREGNPRSLEGVIIPVKDTFPGLDGIMMVGSKTTRVRGVEDSPVMKSLLEAGAIPVPVGMVAAANGGSGMNAGFGYIPHPHRRKFDPAGSSAATGHVIGRKRFPMTVGIGTDTGGSITAPAGAVGLTGFVPPRQFLSTDSMVPFDTSLDRVGVLALHPQDALLMVRELSRPLNGYALKSLHPSTQKSKIVYVQEVLKQASPKAQRHFLDQMENYRKKGFEVEALGEEWNILVEAPLLLFPIDAYGAAAFTHTNPRQRNLWEPPRRSLDRNLWHRLPRGEIALRYGLFDQARHLTKRYQDLVRSKLGPQVVLASPSPEAIPTRKLERGLAGERLDHHDLITMAKNRIPEWAQINLPAEVRSKVGITFSGELERIMHFMPEPKAPVPSAPSPPPTPPRSLGVYPSFVPSPTHGTEAT